MSDNRTVVFRGPEAVEVVDRSIPEPNTGEVLIRTERSLISGGSERDMLAGSHQTDNLPGDGFPMTPGYSNVGTVVAAGPDVCEAFVGERVASLAGHAHYVVVDESACVRVPDDVSSTEASFFRLAQVAMNAVRRGDVRWGERVAVRGLGPVGQLIVRTCLVAGATPVYALDIADSRVEAVPDHQRVCPIHVDRGGTGLEERTADVVIDATGNAETFADGLEFLREDGRFVVVGCPRRSVEFDFYRDCIVPSAHIVGSYRIGVGDDRWSPDQYAELFFKYVRSGEFDVENLVTATPSPDAAPAVYESLLGNQPSELGVVFDWT